MSPADIAMTALILAVVAAALLSVVRGRIRGCGCCGCGSCNGCGGCRCTIEDPEKDENER